MAPTIPSLNRYLRTDGQALKRAISGPRLLRDVRSICSTDRWNSFDRFHDTTRFLTQAYEEAGATTEVYPIRTGGEPGDGRWIIRECSDIRNATVDVVAPVRKRIIDYAKNPWQIIQWSAATPRRGLRSDLVVIDSTNDLHRRRRELRGKTVLTRLSARSLIGKLSAAGALAVVTDRPVDSLPNATAWTKFGWGAIPLDQADARLVGFVLSENEGKRLRALHEKHGSLTLHIKADVRPYMGDHDVVSGIVKGAVDPQEELWVLAHSAEPGAIDNASGVAVCVEAARTMESTIQAGNIRRPKRSIRFLSAFECYGFFNYLEHVSRYQTPIAGLCIDTVGARPDVCERQFSWRATIPMSATFVDRIGETVARSAIRAYKPGYRLVTGDFVSTSDTLAGDPKYGFPCPWITTHYRKNDKVWKAYHSSADVPALLSTSGLATATYTSVAYLAYLADAGNNELIEIARSETDATVERIQRMKDTDRAAYHREQHHVSLERLKRWIWGGSRSEIQSHLNEMERLVRQTGPAKRYARSRHADYARIPRRTRSLAPTLENTREPIASQIRNARLPQWTLFWADGNRTIADIARLVSQETDRDISTEQVADYFEAHEALGYASLTSPDDLVTKKQLVTDLRALGIEAGMNVMVHSSLSAIGHVEGGADTVVDALLTAVGKRGTLVMPSFNHSAAHTFNVNTSPTTNGSIPDAFWRRSGIARSNHPTHAIAACGPIADDLVAGHIEAGVWTSEDPIARLIRADGYIMSLGVDHTSSTVYHVGEVAVPCGCIDPTGNRRPIVEPNGDIRIVPALAFRRTYCPVDPKRLNQTLSKNPKQKSGKIGDANTTLVPVRLVYEARRRHLRDACPTCTVKPAYRK